VALEGNWLKLDKNVYKPVFSRLAKVHRNSHPNVVMGDIFKLKHQSNVFALVSTFKEKDIPHSTMIGKVALLSIASGVTALILSGLSIIVLPAEIAVLILALVIASLDKFEGVYRLKSKLKKEINSLIQISVDPKQSQAISIAPFSADTLVYFYIDGHGIDLDPVALAESFSDYYENYLGQERADLIFPEVFNRGTTHNPSDSEMPPGDRFEGEVKSPNSKGSGFSPRDPQVSKAVFEVPDNCGSRKNPLKTPKYNSL